MSDDLNTELRFGADTTGAEAGVNRVKRSLKDLGDSANKASKDAGDSLGRVGAGGDKAAKDVERATTTVIHVQLTTPLKESPLRVLIRGIDANHRAPPIDHTGNLLGDAARALLGLQSNDPRQPGIPSVQLCLRNAVPERKEFLVMLDVLAVERFFQWRRAHP